MPSCLCNAPSMLQHVFNDGIQDHLEGFVWVYINKNLICIKSAEEHQQHVDLVQELLQQHYLFSCIDKSTFFPRRVAFCGYIID